MQMSEYTKGRLLHAMQCGVDNFTPGQIPSIATGPVGCPYHSQLYSECWHRGWFMALTDYAMKRLDPFNCESGISEQLIAILIESPSQEPCTECPDLP